MGEANYVLGVKIVRDQSNNLFCLSQEPYIKKVLECFHMSDLKPIDIPVNKAFQLTLDQCPKNEKEKISKVSYASAIGSLMYVVHLPKHLLCGGSS